MIIPLSLANHRHLLPQDQKTGQPPSTPTELILKSATVKRKQRQDNVVVIQWLPAVLLHAAISDSGFGSPAKLAVIRLTIHARR
jgi:hypothetical protein